MYSVSAFAEKKGISVGRVRQLVAAGEIPSERSGSSVLIPDAALSWRPRSRRPLGERMAGALLDTLIGKQPSVSDREMLRLRGQRQQLQSSESPAVLLSDLLASRGRREKFSAHPDDLDDLRKDDRVLLSGAHIPEFGLTSGSSVEGYVASDQFQAVKRDYLLRGDPGGNIVLRTSKQNPQHIVPLAAADLADWGAGRELREANRVLRNLLKDAK